jgi:hypothetical protein
VLIPSSQSTLKTVAAYTSENSAILLISTQSKYTRADQTSSKPCTEKKNESIQPKAKLTNGGNPFRRIKRK